MTDAAGRRVVITSHIYVHAIGAAGGCRAGGLDGVLLVLVIGLLVRFTSIIARK